MSLLRRNLLIQSLHALGGLTLTTGFASAKTDTDGVDLPVLECHVAGTTYAGLPDDFEAGLQAGTVLECRREPENPFDGLAIQVLDAQGRKLGYLPRARNEVLARLMDGGVPARAEVTSWERVGSWLRIDVQVRVRLRV
jgi:hypothetical protein